METVLESVKNQKIKDLAKLEQKKWRDQTGTFLVEGIHLIEEASNAGLLKEIYLRKDEPYKVKEFGVPVILCSQQILNKISTQKSDSKILGLVEKKKTTDRKVKKALLLDKLQDPGNVGTLIRSAYSFGIDKIFLSPDCCDVYSPKVIQSCQGALFHIETDTVDLKNAVLNLKEDEVTVYGAALEERAIKLNDLKPAEQYALVIGNEGQGISKELLSLCDQVVIIEMEHFESLNAAVAGSILLYTFYIR